MGETEDRILLSSKEKHAEIYLKQGWSLLPVAKRSKTPLLEWKKFTQERPTIETVKEWFKQWPECELGIITGSISNLIVIDLDGIEGIKEGLKLGLRSSVVAITGKGKHLYYKWQENIKNSVRIRPGIDIRAENGFVLAPPSIHPNGKRYRWERFVPSQLQVFPSKLITQTTTFNKQSETIQPKPQGWIAAALEEMRIGNIDDTLFTVCSRLRHDGYSEKDALVLLTPHAERSGASNGHLADKIRNVWGRYEPASMRPTGLGRFGEGTNSAYSESSELSIHSPADDDSFNSFTSSMASTKRIGTLTGFPTLDKYFECSLQSERPFVIAARTGTGKTNFGIALSFNLCQQGKKVLYFSTEFKYEKIWKWYIPYCKDVDEFRRHSFNVCDSFNPNIEQIEKALIEHKPDIFIFDYIQHIGKEKEILTKFMEGCQFLQRKYNAQSIVLAQIHRAGEFDMEGKSIEPRMSMIEGASAIEQKASRVLLLATRKDDMEKKELIGVLDKNDQGDTGLIHFALYKNPFLFKELI